MEMKCIFCGKVFDLSIWSRTQQYAILRGERYPYCSRECSEKGRVLHSVWTEDRREISRKSMREINHKYASERMKRNNPMFKEEVRQKVSQTLKVIKHHPPIQGGNGRGLTIPQELLIESLSEFHPISEFVVPTKLRSQGYPTNYKIDIAILPQKIAIEVDGGSHGSKKVQSADTRKTEFLNGLGWKVLRFSNREVTEHLETCVLEIVSTISL